MSKRKRTEEGMKPFFDLPQPTWARHWVGMPSYDQLDLEPWQSVVVHFRSLVDREAFSDLVSQKITDRTRSLWFPPQEIGRIADRRFVASRAQQRELRYPLYVISKGRWESRLTVKSLEVIGVPYSLVIEPQEYEQYASVVDPGKILILPFSNLGQGSIPARNFVWEHALESGAARHWILDDNIKGFYRLTDNLKVQAVTGNIFCAAEDFTDRYENIGLSGFNYFMFAKRKDPIPPFVLNTRIYSCILIRNDLPFRWRGRYNEDTDLSLRVLKAGLCTVQFNAFLAFKTTTMTMKGGNTDALYREEDSRLKMAEALRDAHPDVVKITKKWGRAQHSVNYARFKRNKLILRQGIEIPEGEDDYGMCLRLLGEPRKWDDASAGEG